MHKILFPSILCNANTFKTIDNSQSIIQTKIVSKFLQNYDLLGVGVSALGVGALILHKITISRVCMKPKILFPVQKIFFNIFFTRKSRQKSSFWGGVAARGQVVPCVAFVEMYRPTASSSRTKTIFWSKNKKRPQLATHLSYFILFYKAFWSIYKKSSLPYFSKMFALGKNDLHFNISDTNFDKKNYDYTKFNTYIYCFCVKSDKLHWNIQDNSQFKNPLYKKNGFLRKICQKMWNN